MWFLSLKWSRAETEGTSISTKECAALHLETFNLKSFSILTIIQLHMKKGHKLHKCQLYYSILPTYELTTLYDYVNYYHIAFPCTIQWIFLSKARLACACHGNPTWSNIFVKEHKVYVVYKLMFRSFGTFITTIYMPHAWLVLVWLLTMTARWFRY